MSRTDQLYKQRLYEGEHVFACTLCDSTYVEYSFGAEPNEFYDRQQPPVCMPCGTHMIWAGWSGQSDVTEGIASLIDSRHYMAATVMLAAFVEYQIDSLFWAALVGSGLNREKATGIANGTLPRGEALRMIRALLGRKIDNLVFPMRNEVAHGRAFGIPSEDFLPVLDAQLKSIQAWVNSVNAGQTPSGYDYTELDRWVLSMQHWAHWMLRRWKEHRAATGLSEDVGA